ncbi:MAG TPA: MoxR family ATPase [Spirochaetota bacterium]|jgi:MoxR-like ATPase|nr:MoxR family ATPase [Spirochaetota bacterium]OQA99166.1 MAG: ATPase family associated with various cellular activities (AAA) [Spirochaetes bacterium ADurb.Bin218]HOK01460.1 MoxR family ATPase [Spirochaetota bacterium]HOK91527.1 MoxR family ATPase [Spirochaetota bacterium]HON15548.1 MoxR family ATPase [Spirochaetota bacterium]
MNYFKGTDDYVLSKELRDNVNVSIALGRPLIVKGEPGTGKTLLAHSIAKGLGKKFIVWNIKSTTKAQEGLYVYDTVQRLNDARFGDNDVSDIKRYIKLGKLGEAFASDEQVVLLIDEIDKADIEFPNDLLNELDEMSFYIPETKETIKAKTRPIVIITSNSEKELPDPFLRRCIFHYIEFPTQELMEEIVHVHFPDIEKKLLREALKKFYWIREFDMLRKKPSTSELIDWLQALIISGISAKDIEKEIPFLGTLLKKKEDIDIVEKSGKSHYAYNTSMRTRDVY